jgi:protein TonB
MKACRTIACLFLIVCCPWIAGAQQRPRPKITLCQVFGKAISLPKPVYPVAAAFVNASGKVEVQVEIDENGNVVSAKVISGHPLLSAAAIKAALASKFDPVLMSGKPISVYSVITYSFYLNGPPVPVTQNVK